MSVYDVLPSPSNLLGSGSSLEHILSCCPKALRGGRYTWCHNQVLKAVVDDICIGIQQAKHQLPARYNIVFVQAGERPPNQQRISSGLLALAQNWQLQANLVRQQKFQEYIAITSSNRT